MSISTRGVADILATRSMTIEHLDLHSAYYWLDVLANRYPVASGEFKALFISRSKDNQPYQIFGLGEYMSLQVFASKNTLVTKVSLQQELISEETEFLQSANMPFKAIFGQVSRKLQEMQAHIPAEHADIPVLGGWKCNVVTDDLQEVAHFTLPQIVVQGQDRQYDVLSLVGPIVLPTKEECQLRKEELGDRYEGRLSYEPDQDSYRTNLRSVLESLERKELDKIVITRQVNIELNTSQEALPLIAKISEKNYQEYSYYFRWNGGEEWIGVSPEVLLVKEKQGIVTKPLAGTRKISYGQKSEEEIKSELLGDKKEDVEHKHAVNLMLDDLRELAVDKEVCINEDKNILKTPYAYHIKSHICAEMKPGVSTFDVMGCMYPPATIWGIPREDVESVFVKVESFQRDYFAGGLGYCRLNDDSNFALTIRSACLKNGRLSIFAGSGIVENAVPDNEWKETQTKMTPFLSAIEILNEWEGVFS